MNDKDILLAANILFNHRLNKSGLKEKSQDFGYSLGVLHHVPDTSSAISSCVRLLKPGAPFLLYIYYSFDNRPSWFKFLWTISNYIRLGVNRFPKFFKFLICDIIAILIYYPLARFILLIEPTNISKKKYIKIFLLFRSCIF